MSLVNSDLGITNILVFFKLVSFNNDSFEFKNIFKLSKSLTNPTPTPLKLENSILESDKTSPTVLRPLIENLIINLLGI